VRMMCLIPGGSTRSDDANALAIDPNHVVYTQLGDLDTATEKARRDAPAIAVCDLGSATS